MPKFPDCNMRRRPGRGFAPACTLLLIGLLAAAPLAAQALPPEPEPGRLPSDRTVMVSLYFADSSRFALQAEQRQLTRPNDPAAFGEAIIRALTTGPQDKHRRRTLPGGNILRAFFVDADKTAYVDFNNDMWAHHPDGVQADILAIYSIVNSLVLNMAEVDAVKFLNLGREPITTAAHLDLRYPLKANILLVR